MKNAVYFCVFWSVSLSVCLEKQHILKRRKNAILFVFSRIIGLSLLSHSFLTLQICISSFNTLNIQNLELKNSAFESPRKMQSPMSGLYFLDTILFSPISSPEIFDSLNFFLGDRGSPPHLLKVTLSGYVDNHLPHPLAYSTTSSV